MNERPAAGDDVGTAGDGAASAAVEALYERDRVHRPQIELLEASVGAATVAMTVAPDMVNGHGTCHGGLIFTLADTAFAYACNSHGRPTVAAGASIDFIAPANVGDRLTAEGVERHRGRRRGIYDITVTRGETVIAIFQGRSHEV